MYKLLCGRDPVALGIEENGKWDMAIFSEHVKNCEICKCILSKIMNIKSKKQINCRRCGHVWYTSKDRPKACPACKRYDYDK